DLVELLLAGDQRRGELDDRIAAVVGAADQAAPVELAGEEPAQKLLRFGGVEGFLGVLVLDELDRHEVTGAANVAHDREIAQALEHRAQGTFVLEHPLAKALALDDVDVGERDRARDWVPAEGEAVVEDRLAVHERL